MLTKTFLGGGFATNGYLVAAEAGAPAVLFDPGIGVAPQIQQWVTKTGCTPAAIVLTHGHIDHVQGVPSVLEAWPVPVYIHAADEYRMTDPFAGIPTAMLGMLEQITGPASQWVRPIDLREVPGNGSFDVAGLSFTTQHAPGHTEGSVVFTIDAVPSGADALPQGSSGADLTASTCTIFTGDVLFAGSIGRTDLPGGDSVVMARTLAEVVTGLPTTGLVLSGHGPSTTMAAELRTNPFLKPGALDGWG